MAGEAEPSAPATVAGAPQEPVAAASPAAAAPAASPEPAAPVAPEPAAITEPVTPEPAAPLPEPTLLQKFDKEQAEKKPAEPAKTEPAKPDVPAAAAKPPGELPKDAKAEGTGENPAPSAPEPVAYEYALPETIKLDDATKATFHAALDAVRADPAKGAQGLIDLHNKAMTDYATEVSRNQMKVWNDTRQGWRTDVMADEQLGGAGYQTTMGAVARMRDLLVPEKHRAAFDQMLSVTGVGDHPEFLRVLHNAARIYDEAPMPPPGARPTPDQGKPPGRGGLRGLYKSTNGQGRQ